MRLRVPFLGAVLALFIAGVGTFHAQDKAKLTIGDVMEEAHESGLLKKVLEGKASKEEKAKLADLYTSLPLNKPPKGDDKSWKTKTTALLDAAKAVVKDEKAIPKLKSASTCAACHKVHKE